MLGDCRFVGEGGEGGRGGESDGMGWDRVMCSSHLHFFVLNLWESKRQTHVGESMRCDTNRQPMPVLSTKYTPFSLQAHTGDTEETSNFQFSATHDTPRAGYWELGANELLERWKLEGRFGCRDHHIGRRDLLQHPELRPLAQLGHIPNERVRPQQKQGAEC